MGADQLSDALRLCLVSPEQLFGHLASSFDLVLEPGYVQLEQHVEAVALDRLQRVTEVEQLVGRPHEGGLVVAVLQDLVERVDERLAVSVVIQSA